MQFRHEARRLSTFPDVMDNRKMRTAERRGRASGKETDRFRLVLFVFAPLVRLRRSSYTRRVPLSEAQHNVGRKSPLESHRRRTLIILLSSSAFPFPHTFALIPYSSVRLGFGGKTEWYYWRGRKGKAESKAESGERRCSKRREERRGMILDALTRHTSMVAGLTTRHFHFKAYST